MKTRTWLALAAATTVVVGVSAFAIRASAFGPGGGWGCQGPAMMHGAAGFGPGMRHGGFGPGMMMGGGPGFAMLDVLDTDGDGSVGIEEGQVALRTLLETHDTDGDGTLSVEEFQTLHAEVTRPMTVDRFQFLDDDGDGRVTSEEMQAPFTRMARWMDADGDGTFGPGDRRFQGGPGMMGPGPWTMQRQP